MSGPTVEEMAALRREMKALADDLADHERRDEDGRCPFTADEIRTLKRSAMVFDTLEWLGKWIVVATGGLALFGVNLKAIKDFFTGGGQ